MQRRSFLTLLSASSAAWPLAAGAQQRPTMPLVGYLDISSLEASASLLVAFRKGLSETGFVEGQNVAIDFRWANANAARLPVLAKELVQRQANVIVAVGAVQSPFAARAATSAIPIVFAYGGDPVNDGLVASLNRPGGNLTGVTYIHNELGGKRLNLLRDLVPRATTVAYLSSNSSAFGYDEQKRRILAAAAALGRQLIIAEPGGDLSYETAFTTLVERQAEALIVGAFVFPNAEKIVALAARHKIPTIYPGAGFVRGGGLMSYGAVSTDIIRQAGVYTGRILKGDSPADLPVQQPTKFEFVVNLQTARSLGLTVPPLLLTIADEVIE
jgi:ABC-type uncharacterized transport system substrate-binding protein